MRYVIAEHAPAAVSVARMIDDGLLPDLYASREAMTSAFMTYPVPMQMRYFCFGIDLSEEIIIILPIAFQA